MSVNWRTVRVFLSSTFRDMHAERDHLIRVTFPALREKLLPFRVELYDIDLRWGITEDEAKNEKVIGLCLEQIDDCRPFFLAFLGQRYGWVPDRVPDETHQKFPFVSRFPDASVTELEIRHGVMPDEAGGHTLVLLRKEDAVASIPAAIRNRDFVETDPQRQQQLEALKRELETGPYRVRAYSTVWDPQRYDRVNHTAGKLDGLADFGREVEDWLWEAIRSELQLPATPAAVDPLDAEVDLHERFLELRTRIYVGRAALFCRLRDFARASGAVPLLLTGESGSGKSAALARFIRDFRQQHPDVFVLPHFVGASPRTTSLAGMLRRLTDELRRRFNLTLPKAEAPDEILHTFRVALASVPASTHVVLVFDALNQLDADSRADSLVWLPAKLPPNVRVLCSAATGPQQTPRVLTAFGARSHVAVPLEPLTDAERRDIIRAVPKLVAKTLDDRQIDTLLANPATHNPLYLMVALEELRGFGSFEQLNDLIGGLPREGDSVTELFRQVFNRLEVEFNRPLVDCTLRLLACARRGLSGPELVELTRDLGSRAEDLYPLLRQLRPYLQERAGLFDFYHHSIRRAVEIHYLRWEKEEDQYDPWVRWAPERQGTASEPTEPEREAREWLITFLQTSQQALRWVDELPWQLAQLRSWQRLHDFLADLGLLRCAWEANSHEVRAYWAQVETASPLRMADAYRPVLADPASYSDEEVALVAWIWSQVGDADQVEALWCNLADRSRGTSDWTNLALSLANLAAILHDRGNRTEAMALQEEAIRLCLEAGNLPLYRQVLQTRAVFLKAAGDLDGALVLLRQLETTYRQEDDRSSLCSNLSYQASIMQLRGDFERALRLFEEQERLCRELNEPDALALSLSNQAIVQQALGRLRAALLLNQEAVAILRSLGHKRDLAHCLGNLATIHNGLGELDQALCLFREQEGLSRELDVKDGLQYALGNQANILCQRGDLPEAMTLFDRQEVICRETNNLQGLYLALSGKASVCHLRGAIDRSVPLLQEAEQVCRGLGSEEGLATVLRLQGDVAQSKGEVEPALRLYEEAERLCHKIRKPSELVHCLMNHGRLLALSLRLPPSQVLPIIEQAYRLALECDMAGAAEQIKPTLDRYRAALAQERAGKARAPGGPPGLLRGVFGFLRRILFGG